jgi:hypothetical protein
MAVLATYVKRNTAGLDKKPTARVKFCNPIQVKQGVSGEKYWQTFTLAIKLLKQSKIHKLLQIFSRYRTLIS